MAGAQLTVKLSFARIKEAARTIDPVFLGSPQYECEALGEGLGVSVVLKVETANPVRCFKGRGASYCVSKLTGEGPLVCASAGNFGQAMAYACRGRRPLIVYAGATANRLKIERMRALGADIRLSGEDFDEAKLEARRWAAEAGVQFVEDGREQATAEGAGTIGLELSRVEGLDAVLAPLGNGALLGGVATALRKLAPRVRIVAVQAAGAPAMTESLQSRTMVSYPEMRTIADGIGVWIPIPEALAYLRGLVDEFLLVEEDSIVTGMRLIHRHAGLVVEPSGAVGVAALLENSNPFLGKRVATILCGGNLTPEQMREWLG